MIYACQRKDVDACADLWGGRVVMGKEELNDKTPIAPIDMTKDLACPPIGIFGNEDRAPSPEQVNEQRLRSRSTARPTSSTATTEPATASGIGTGHFTDPSRQGWLGQGLRLLRQASGEVGGPRHVYVHHRDRTCRGHGKARGQIVPLSQAVVAYATRAMRRWAMSLRSTLSTLALNPGRERGLS